MTGAVELRADLQREGVAVEEQAGGGLRARPADEALVARCLRIAERHGRRVVPTGFGSQLASLRPDVQAAPALLLDTRALCAVVAYEPGDGTLTAQAGCSFAELARRVSTGGHRLTPALGRPALRSLGGAIGAGESGSDRERYGPLRHHLLGLRVALADGTIAKSGGRLVKNVTGFDLHRLHCGARGTLGVILEASLRLFPEPEQELALSFPSADPPAAWKVLAELRGERIEWASALLVEEPASAALRVHLFLSGRGRQVAHDAERVTERVGSAERREGAAVRELRCALADALAEPSSPRRLRLQARPSRIVEAWRLTRATLAALGAAPRFLVQPFAGTADCGFDLDERLVEALARDLPRLQAELATRGARIEARALPLVCHRALTPAAGSLALEWMERVRAALDPKGTLASPSYPCRT